jgi:hypothetical protein
MVTPEALARVDALVGLDRRIRLAWRCDCFRHTPTGPACAIADDRHCGLLQYPRAPCPLEEVGSCTAWKADLPPAREDP